MPFHLPRDGRSLHNFAREPPSPLSKPTINHPKRLVRKYRKSKVQFKNNFEKMDKERVTGSGEKSTKPTSARNDISNTEMTAVPDPVPDTGLSPATNKLLGTHHTIIPIMVPTETPIMLPVSTFKPLPPLLSVTASPTTSVASYISAPSSFSNLPQAQEHHPPTQPHHLSVVIITLLAVGSAFFFVGIFVVVKACSHPKRRTHLTPSLPIFEDDQFEANVSPIFGGKERYSPRPGSSGGLYTWTQYPHLENAIAKPTRAVGYGKAMDAHPSHDAISGTGGKKSQVMTSNDTGFNEKKEYPFAGTGPYQAPFQQVQDAVTRIASRLSAASLSLYPNSPPNDAHVGIAVEGGPPFTADGYPVIKRTKSKTALQKNREAANIESAYVIYSQGLAYDGADVTSPVISTQPHSHALSHVPSAASGGRSRIKSTYYAPGTYPRMSAAPGPDSASVKTNHGNANPFESQHTLRKSDSRRERDTHALTSALGLPSPSLDLTMASSPQPTLYPDDSLSIVEDFYARKTQGHGPGRGHKRPAPKNTGATTTSRPGHDFSVTAPNVDASAVLGNLMLLDFLPTSKSLATLGTPGEGMASTSSSSPSLGLVKSVSKKSFRSDDKPPRVPSPPPMPSLTQMGLEHRNPEAYGEYRSPTYSIYGLYESDRKSRVGSMGQ